MRLKLSGRLDCRKKKIVELMYSECGASFEYDAGDDICHILIYDGRYIAGYARADLFCSDEKAVFSVMIKKKFRRKGLFTEFAREADELFEGRRASFLTDKKDPGAAFIAEKNREGLLNADYLMTLKTYPFSQSKVTLREADRRGFDRLVSEIFFGETSSDVPGDEYYDEEAKTDFVSEYYITAGGTDVGAVMMCFGSEKAYFSFFCIKEDYRGLGYAKSAVDAMSDLAYSKGMKTLSMHVSESNVAALSLYKKCGFETTEGLYEYRIIK